MKKIFLLCLLLSVYSSRASFYPEPVRPRATELMIILPGTESRISLAAFVRLSPKAYHLLTGRKTGLVETLKLKWAQKAAKKLIRKDGTVDLQKWNKRRGFFDSWHWHWGGFALGFLLIFGPFIALFFQDEYRWDRFWTSMTVAIALMSGMVALLTSF